MIATLAAAAQTDATNELFDFSRGYVVWAGSDGGRCNFFMIDVGENARQLTETLRENYNVTVGIEVLTDKHTPGRCAIAGVRAVKKQDFNTCELGPARKRIVRRAFLNRR